MKISELLNQVRLVTGGYCAIQCSFNMHHDGLSVEWWVYAKEVKISEEFTCWENLEAFVVREILTPKKKDSPEQAEVKIADDCLQEP